MLCSSVFSELKGLPRVLALALILLLLLSFPLGSTKIHAAHYFYDKQSTINLYGIRGRFYYLRYPILSLGKRLVGPFGCLIFDHRTCGFCSCVAVCCPLASIEQKLSYIKRRSKDILYNAALLLRMSLGDIQPNNIKS